MHRPPLFRILVTPSLLSGSLAILGSIGFLGYNAWLYFTEKQFFYDIVFGPYGLQTYLWQHSTQAITLRTAFFGSAYAYYILVFVTAIIVGLAIYALLQGLALLTWQSRQLMERLADFGSTRREIIRTLAYRLGVRALSLVGLTGFAAYFLSTLLPFVMVLNRTGIDYINHGHSLGGLACVGAVVILSLAIHILVVLVRMAFLKPRLFFGDSAIEEAEARSANPSP